MNEKISNYKTRLINPAAEIEFVVQIERSTFRAMELHNIIKRKAVELELNEQELNVLQSDEIDMKVAQLDAISQELMIALESDEKELWSELVHDQPQIVEIEELKVRLQARLENETKVLSQLEEEKRVKMIHIRNIENDIKEADEGLAIENGALMKRMRLDKPFRCVGLCAANASGNEVSGTATGGFEEFAAADGCNIHMLDYHNGEVNHVFMGGNDHVLMSLRTRICCLLEHLPLIYAVFKSIYHRIYTDTIYTFHYY